MTILYLVRHAEAEGNWRRTFQGHVDSEISQKGYRQLDYLSERFRDIPLDVIYSSPLKRAYETACAINRYHNLPITTDKGLMEINGGDFEGVPFAELPQRFPVENTQWEQTPWDFVAPHGESMREVYARMRDTITRILRENQGKSVAVASHGCAIRNFLCFVRGWGIERVGDGGWCDNTAVSMITYDDQLHPAIQYLNDASHLPEEVSTFATQSWWRKDAQRAAKAAP